MELVTDNVIWTIKTRKNREISFPGENFIFFEVNLFRKKKKKEILTVSLFLKQCFRKIQLIHILGFTIGLFSPDNFVGQPERTHELLQLIHRADYFLATAISHLSSSWINGLHNLWSQELRPAVYTELTFYKGG